MKCIRCGKHQSDDVLQCACGFPFHVAADKLDAWFDEVRETLEKAYLATNTPWEQSGYGGPRSFGNWIRLRIPISECIDRPGSLLDIGCANGFLLQCLRQWMQARQLAMELYGLDYSEPLVSLARMRLPDLSDQIFVDNALYWDPPRRFDYVYTMPEFVPVNWIQPYLSRLLAQFVAPDGKLLVMYARDSGETNPDEWGDVKLRRMGFAVEAYHSGFDEQGRERARVVIVGT
jgi:SAM-dependent methyltransferase